MRTTRERIADALREAPHSPNELATRVDTDPETAIEHVRHLAASLEHTDETLLVAPPTCRACGFDGFDDPANRPSRCPECKSEGIDEPTFVVRST